MTNMPPKAGDWYCPKCTEMNFASRNSCRKCSTARVVLASSSTAAKPGDWKCGCGEVNFARNTACRKCSTPKFAAAASPQHQTPQGPPAPRPGDWKCGCGCPNFASRTNCRDCNAPKPSANSGAASSSSSASADPMQVDGENPAAAVKPREGDWKCVGCGDMNFAFRTQCRRCDKTKDVAQMKSGDWLCPKCQEVNFMRREACFVCGTRKDGTQPAQANPYNIPAEWKHRILNDVTPHMEPVTDPNVLQTIGTAMLGTDHCGKGSKFKITRVMRVENIPLWKSFQRKKEEISEFLMAERSACRAIAPAVASVHPCTDPSLNEYFLFHGTAENVATLIARHGFDERVSNLTGLYGAGTYFAEQWCKSLQYSKANAAGEYMMLYCRVVLGDPYFTSKQLNIRRPPAKNETTGFLYDSVIANPGQGNGGKQIHREFIVYDRAQVYPEYLVYFKN